MEHDFRTRRLASFICSIGRKLHRLHLRNDSTEVTPSHSGKYVQLCTANHRVYRSSSHGIGTFGWQKGIAIGLVFLGVYIVTQSKSRADLEKEGEL